MASFAAAYLRRLILSKVGNFAIDLPDANVMVQVSGTFGSRQEEAQRLGRILRPKEGEVPARFYTLVSRDTREMDFAHHRQLFLTEQGYTYEILDESDLALGDVDPAGGDWLNTVLVDRLWAPNHQLRDDDLLDCSNRCEAAQERDPGPHDRAGLGRGAAGPQDAGALGGGAVVGYGAVGPAG